MGGVAVLVLIVQAVLIQQLYVRTDQLKNQELKTVLIDAVRGLNTEPAVDPQTGRHFIPSSRIVLPATLDSRVYYRAGGEEFGLWFIDAHNQSQAIHKVQSAESLTNTFEELKILQMCSRQVVVSFGAADPKGSDDKLTLKSTKQLKDGRTAHIYQNACPYGAEPLLRSIDKIESF